MRIVPLQPPEIEEWNCWLRRSHGLGELTNHTIYRCDIECQAYLTPWPELDDFHIREERFTHAKIMAFDLCPGTQTIASLWSDIGSPLGPLSPIKDIKEAKKLLKVAALQGRLWWGTQSLTDSLGLTSVCYLFPQNFHFPVKKIIHVEEPPPSMEIELQLV